MLLEIFLHSPCLVPRYVLFFFRQLHQERRETTVCPSTKFVSAVIEDSSRFALLPQPLFIQFVTTKWCKVTIYKGSESRDLITLMAHSSTIWSVMTFANGEHHLHPHF